MKLIFIIIVGIAGLFLLYNILKISIFLVGSVLEGILALFTSGAIFFIILSFIAYKYRKEIKHFLEKTLFQKSNSNVGKYDYLNVIDNHAIEKSQSLINSKELLVNQKGKINESRKFNDETMINFVGYIKGLSEGEIKKFFNNTYNKLSEKYNNNPVCGQEGTITLVAAILLTEYDKSETEIVFKGINKVFDNSWTDSAFKNYMDTVIKSGRIRYNTWIEACDHLKNNHKWIFEHECSKENNKVLKNDSSPHFVI